MALTLLEDTGINDLLICEICACSYDEEKRVPINITCGHTICLECVNTLKTKQGAPMLSCPVCRHVYKGHITNGVYECVPPKNFQLLSIVATCKAQKAIADEKLKEQRYVNCRDCNQRFTEDSLTQCPCVIATSNGQLDFMGRPKNKLICEECITANHKEHNPDPISVVKATHDNMIVMNDIKKRRDRIAAKTESMKRAFNNCNEELSTVLEAIENTIVRLDERQKDNSLYCLASKLRKKLEHIEKMIGNVSNDAYIHTTQFRAHVQFVRDFGASNANQPANVVVPGNPQPPRQQPPNPVQLPQPVPERILQPVLQPVRHRVLQLQPPRQVQQQPAPPPPQPPQPIHVAEGMNIRDVVEAGNANAHIIIHVANGNEQEARVQEIMDRFVDVGENQIRVGNNGPRDEHVQGMLRGVFDFLAQLEMEPNDPQQNDEVVDEFVVFEQEQRDGGVQAAQNMQRRRLQIRRRLVRDVDAVVVNPPVVADVPVVNVNVPDEPAVEEEMNEARIEQPAIRRGRGRLPRRAGGQVVPAQPMVVEEPIALRRTRRNQPRHDPIQPEARGNVRNRRQGTR